MTTKLPQLILKPGKEKPIKNFHHWIFSGAIKQFPKEAKDGDFVSVYGSNGELLGSAYINRKTSITARMVSFDNTEPIDSIVSHMDKAIAVRNNFFDDTQTNAFRLINSEGDGIPGLVVDKYDDVIVVQITTLGIEKIKADIVDYLVNKLKPICIYERSDMPSRREEGLKNQVGLLYGEGVKEKAIKEYGALFKVDFVDSQKTGFFLDQREMRQQVKKLAKNKKVLNCFSYTGGFSVMAGIGGAQKGDSVDISDPAIELAKENFCLNDLDIKHNSFIVEDVFEFLRKDSEKNIYDFIILDPPAFAKKRGDIVKACRGYKDINRLALQNIQSSGILITSSCSYYVDEKLFQQVVFEAAVEAKRSVRIIDKHHYAPDHPINIFHPEGNYLKSLVLWVE